MRTITNTIRHILYWADLSSAAATAIFGTIFWYLAAHFWHRAQDAWELAAIPYKQWAETDFILTWFMERISPEFAFFLLQAWVHLCLAGFLATSGILAFHELYCRLRVRLG